MPESALAEAMVFRVLQACKVNPVVADTPGIGGPDFCCLDGTPQSFMVEATSLLPERVTKESHILVEQVAQPLQEHHAEDVFLVLPSVITEAQPPP